MRRTVSDRARFLAIDDLQIAAYESPGDRGPGVFLLHGNSSSARVYQRLLDGKLGRELRLAAIDLPGHGRSDRAREDPAKVYRLGGYAAVVVEAARRLELTRGVFVGWSLGGDILLQAARRLPEAAGFLIFGTAPLRAPHDGSGFIPGSPGRLGLAENLSAEQIATYGRAFFRPGAADLPDFVFRDLRATDPRARKLLGLSLKAGRYRDEAAVLAGLRCPVAIVHGLEEQFVDLAYLERLAVPSLWRGAAQTVERAGHAVHLERPHAFERLLQAFVTTVAG